MGKKSQKNRIVLKVPQVKKSDDYFIWKPKNHISLPLDMLILIFSFLDSELDLLSCSRVCKSWEIAASSEKLWQNLSINKGISSWYSSTHFNPTSESSPVVGIDWKSIFRNYYLACKTGHNILAGPYGKASACHLNYDDKTPVLVQQTSKSSFVPLAHKLKRQGGGCMMLLIPRFTQGRQGQALILTAEFNQMKSSRKKISCDEKFLLNIFNDCATKSYKKQ